MTLENTSKKLLKQLSEVIIQLGLSEYSSPLPILSGASVGQHIRHILEFYSCLNQGALKSSVNYDKRERNTLLEQDTSYAIEQLKVVLEETSKKSLKQPLTLVACYSEEEVQLKTTYERELAYNIEHAIHHMAIIKIGILALYPSFNFPEHFGVAYSTVKYQKALCAQ